MTAQARAPITRRLLLGATGSALLARSALGAPLRKIVIGLSSGSLGTASARVAQQLGLFEAHGLDAKIIIMDSANAATAALIARSIDFALSGPGELIAAQAHGQDVVILANTYAGVSVTLDLAKPVADRLRIPSTAPVADRLRALDGLLIASTNATSVSTLEFKLSAASVGATIRFTHMALPAMVAAIERGTIDGFIGPAPYWALPVLKGTAVVWISGPKGELPPEFSATTSGNLQVLRTAAAADPDLVRRVVASFDDVATAVANHPGDVKSAVAKLFPDLDPRTLDILLSAEAATWMSRKLTPADMAHEIALAKRGNLQVPDSMDPATLLYP